MTRVGNEAANLGRLSGSRQPVKEVVGETPTPAQSRENFSPTTWLISYLPRLLTRAL